MPEAAHTPARPEEGQPPRLQPMRRRPSGVPSLRPRFTATQQSRRAPAAAAGWVSRLPPTPPKAEEAAARRVAAGGLGCQQRSHPP